MGVMVFRFYPSVPAVYECVGCYVLFSDYVIRIRDSINYPMCGDGKYFGV